MKRLALCFSGGIRHFDSCIPSLIKYLINPLKQNYKVDIFLYLTYINQTDNIDVDFKMVKSNFNKDKLINILKPTKYTIIEYNNDLQIKEMIVNNKDFNNYEWDDEKCKNYGYSAFGMYSKIYKCNKLKSDYEKKHNFKYDLVFRGRLDYIFLDSLKFKEFNNKTLYLVKDRFASHTELETNDKFFGAPSELMDKVCNIYNELPRYLDEFKKKDIMFEGQSIINYRIKELKISEEIEKVKMICHRNTYYKCQGRHQIKKSMKKVFIHLKNIKLLKEIVYKLCYFGYQVYCSVYDEFLNLFSNYNFIKEKQDIIYEYILVESNYRKHINFKNKKLIINYDINKYKRTKRKIEKLDELIKSYDIDEELPDELVRMSKKTYIHIKEDYNIKKLSNIIFQMIDYQSNYQVYKIDEEYNVKLGDNIRYYIPDRGCYYGIVSIIDMFKKDKIKGISSYKGKVYSINKEKKVYYMDNEIEILNYDNHIKEKYLIEF